MSGKEENKLSVIKAESSMTSRISRRDRLEIVRLGILVRYAYDFNLPPMTDATVKFTAQSWERHLTNSGCPPERYEEVYDAAYQLYVKEGRNKGPFNSTFLVAAWNELNAEEKKPEPYKALPDKTEILCGECNDTGLEFIKENGRWKGLVYEEGKVKKCEHCKDN